MPASGSNNPKFFKTYFMKRSVALLLFTFCLQLVARSQQSESQTLNHFYYIADSNKLETLEKVEAAMKSKSKLGGFGGTSSAYVMEGSSSSVHIASQQPSFGIFMSSMMDPSQVIRLFRFEKKDKSRESVVSKSGPMGKNNNSNFVGINYSVKKNEKGMYIIVPDEPLQPGEYGFINMMLMSGNTGGRGGMPNYMAFAFSIR